MASFDSRLPRHLLQAIKEKKLSSCLLEVQALAAQGDAAACIALAHAFFYGVHGVKRNYEEARHWLEKIGGEDDVTGYAPYRLGIIYYRGLGVKPDHRRAFRNFRTAALRGNCRSLLMVAAMQKEGDGTLKKPHAAKVIFYSCARNSRLGIFTRALAFLWTFSWMRRWAPWNNKTGL